MEQNDAEAIKEHLLETSQEYRDMARQHLELDRMAQGEQDDVEGHRLKKLKLQIKDQMEGMVARYKTQTV